MGYTKKVWEDGDVIESSFLNNIENGIDTISKNTDCIYKNTTNETLVTNNTLSIASAKDTKENLVGKAVLDIVSENCNDWYASFGKYKADSNDIRVVSNTGNMLVSSLSGETLIEGKKLTRLGANAVSKAQVGSGQYGMELSLSGPSSGWSFATYGGVPINLGSTNGRYGTLYSTSSPNVSSDKALKHNISYIENKELAKTNSNSISTDDMYNFVKNDLRLANYNLTNEETTLGFIAQDCLENTIVGKEFIRQDENGLLSYDTGAYTNILAGALQKALNKIDDLEARIIELEK